VYLVDRFGTLVVPARDYLLSPVEVNDAEPVSHCAATASGVYV
jgi:hypothetical protein